MAFFEFPHTRTYDSDLGFIIKWISENNPTIEQLTEYMRRHEIEYSELKDLVDSLIRDITDINVWDPMTAYRIFTIVEHEGTNYIAIKDVPVGIDIGDTDYWQPANTIIEQINAIGIRSEEIGREIALKVSHLDYKYEGMKIIGHAGASDLAPSNTLAGFMLAAMLKADAIECDVQITGDGTLVCCHNDRINGYVIRQNDDATILAQVNTGPYAEKFNQANLTVPKFESFCKVCKNAGVIPVVEIKWEGSHILTTELYKIKEALDLYGLTEHAILISWYPEPLEYYLANVDPNAKIMLLLGDQVSVSNESIIECSNKGYYGVGIPRYSNPMYCDVAHYWNLKTNVFTITMQDSVTNSFIDIGCDFFTNGSIIDCGSTRNPYVSVSAGREGAVHTKNGISVLSKFFAENTDIWFPTFNTNTSRFTTDPAEIAFPARLSDKTATYAMIAVPCKTGDVFTFKIPDGYRASILLFNPDGTYHSGTSEWITTDGTYTVLGGNVAVISYTKTDASVMNFWDLQTVHNCVCKN